MELNGKHTNYVEKALFLCQMGSESGLMQFIPMIQIEKLVFSFLSPFADLPVKSLCH